MTTFTITTGNGSPVTLKDVTIAENIRNSMNSAKESKVDDKLKSKLSELTDLVAKMSQELSVEKGKEVTQDLRNLVDEATKEKPRRKWYELSAEGIIDAAKTCASIAAPVIAVVKEILGLLG